MSLEWKDISCYSQGDKERIPVSYELAWNRLRIVVTRNINYDKDTWIMRCSLFNPDVILASKEIEAAKDEALGRVCARIETLQGYYKEITEYINSKEKKA